jgi:hypothetical protein
METSDLKWRKSSFSSDQGGECVEVADGSGTVMVRDTTNRDGGTLAFGAAAWSTFLGAVK